MNDTEQFYDGLADDYRFIFADWQQSVHRQAEIMSRFLESLGETAPKTILDCTCGIGTQAIGLGIKGYNVSATDLSSQSIERAREYAAQFEMTYPIQFGTADLLHPPKNPTQHDIVLAYDNPIAHFHSDEDLRRAFRTMIVQLKDGGLLTTSLRDYDRLAQEKPRQSLVTVTDDEHGRRIMFQVWDWLEDGSGYASEMFVITQSSGDTWKTQSHKARFRAWQRADVSRILAEAGLSDIEWHMPEQSGFYQPIVTARK